MKKQVINGKIKFYNEQDKQLMSYSRVSSPWTEDKFDKIPKIALDKATIFGSNVSELVLKAFSGTLESKELQDPNIYTQSEIMCLKSIISKVEEMKLKPTFIEKHIANDHFHGYLDIECEECFIEIKTRSTDALELSTVIQCEIYKRITGKDYYIFQVNRKTYKCTTYSSKEIPADMLDKANQVINAFETIHNIL